jgi:hypothetical protein
MRITPTKHRIRSASFAPSPVAGPFPRRAAAACLLAFLGCSDAPPDDESTGAGGEDGGNGFIEGGTFVPSGGNTGGGIGPVGGSTGGSIGPVGGNTGGSVGPVGGETGGGGGIGPVGGESGGTVGPVGGEGGGGQVERPATLVAAIVLSETPQVPQAGLSVTVTEPVELPNAPGCSVVQVNPNAPAPAPATGYDAGTITVGGVAGAPLTFSPQAGGAGTTYTGPGIGSDVFSDGAMITAQAAGGPHMGAFSLQVQAPQSLNITEPRQQFGQTLDAGDALSVRWNAGGAESLLITVLPADGLEFTPSAGSWVFCGVPDTGSFDIPAGTLNRIADGAGPFGQGALVTLTRTRVATTQVGTDQAVLTASTTQAVPVTFSP